MSLATPDWYRSIARFLCPEGWPENYLVVDIETNGLGPTALPLQIAWLSIVDRKPNPEGSGTLLLDWTQGTINRVPAEEMERTIEATRQAMAERGNSYRFSLELLQREGCHPAEGLSLFYRAIGTIQGPPRGKIVGFNHCFFDLPILDRCMRKNTGYSILNPASDLLDLGLIEKARLHRPRLEPIEGEEIGAWYQFVADARLKGGWRLDLARQLYSLDCDPSKAHDAGADCFDTHLLLEAMRRLME